MAVYEVAGEEEREGAREEAYNEGYECNGDACNATRDFAIAAGDFEAA